MQRRWALGSMLMLACGDDGGREHVKLPTIDACDGQSDRILCSGGAALTCVDGDVAKWDGCSQRGMTCAHGVGCRACEPSSVRCDGNKRFRCAADGSAETLLEECAANLWCSPDGCADLCADAAEDRSYLGCDYWPVFTVNSQLADEFFPAVTIGNGNLVPAHVTLSRAGQKVAELDLTPKSASTIDLAFDTRLKKPSGSQLVRGGAYHLQSNVPVTVHQFNPLLFELGRDCAQEPEGSPLDDRQCYSYTNDASLLFPSAALAPATDEGASRVEFIAVSRPSFARLSTKDNEWHSMPGFVAITAVGSQRVHVRIESSAHAQASPSGAPDLLPALRPGDVLERDLEPGDVLQLVSALSDCSDSPAAREETFCDPGPGYDLTGTTIHADGPVQVISGHDCSYVPFNRVACDHLEESVPPVSTWGNRAVLAVPLSSAGSEYLLRVVSGSDNNVIRFEPAVHEPVTLNRGQSFELRVRESLLVQGSGRLLAAQYLFGQGQFQRLGDPSLSFGVPIDQYRQRYDFVTPSTYDRNIIAIIATQDDVITLDGEIVTGFAPVGASNFRVASVVLERAGAHQIVGTRSIGFGIVLYGLGAYTSYMLPGGLDLAPLVIAI